MSIESIYQDLILDQIIKDMLNENISLTTNELINRYNTFIETHDLSKPLFDLDNAKVITLENASASKWNNTNQEILRDLIVTYKAMFKITSDSLVNFDRWRTELALLESQLKTLDTRISNLISTQTNLNTFFISDDFVDTSKIDLVNTTAAIDLKHQTVTLNTSTPKPTRFNLNDIQAQDIQFTALTRSNLQEVVTAPFGELINAFIDDDSFWQSRVKTNDFSLPITGELKVKLSDSIVNLNKITFKLHSSNTISTVQITPMISIDNINFIQLPITDITLSVNDLAIWNFPKQEVKYIKFIMTKNGYDFFENKSYIYEFGAENISFYTENFTSDQSSELVSNILSANDIDNNPIEWNKVSLQVCERVPTDTFIDYYIAPLANPTDTPVWHSISHSADEQPLFANTLSFGDINNITVSGIMLSYNPQGALSPNNFVNPGQAFTLVDVSSGIATTASVVSSAQRYAHLNSNERILEHEIKSSIDILNNSIEVFRNVGQPHDTTPIRTIQRGWGFSEPYYYSVVEIINQNGLNINFGEQNIILDNVIRNGKVNFSKGIHTIKIHKNNWITISSGATSLATIGDLTSLQTLDPLYPFNHKYLIEGYILDNINNPYIGVDIFAEFYMSQVSIDDLNNSVSSIDYTKFAIDIDAIDDLATINGITGSTGSNIVFVVKSDENYSDFLDELFTIRFDIKNQLFKYIKFKAKLNTLNSDVAPNLDGYKLRLSY